MTENHEYIKGDKWYAVNMEVLKDPQPKGSHIQNNNLVDENDHILSTLRRGVDYDFVPYEQWKILRERGFDKEIERKIIESEKGLIIEEYPPIATFYFENSESKNTESKEDLNSNFTRKKILVSQEDNIYETIKILFLSQNLSNIEFTKEYKVSTKDIDFIGAEASFKDLKNEEMHIIIRKCKKFTFSNINKQKGLLNLGNTCFMNSAIQCLYGLEDFSSYFINNEYKKDINLDNPLGFKGEIATAFAELMQEMTTSESKAVNPIKFKKTFGIQTGKFTDYSEHDATEFLNFVLDGIHEDLNKIEKRRNCEDDESSEKQWQAFVKGNNSVVTNMFYGQLVSILECMKCSRLSKKHDAFMYLSLPIPRREELHPNVYLCYESDNKIPIKIVASNEWTIDELKEILKSKYEVKKDILCVSQNNNKITKIIENKRKLKNIKTNIYCYEYNADEENDYIWLNIKISTYFFLNYNFNHFFLIKAEDRTSSYLYGKIVNKLEPFIIPEKMVYEYHQWKGNFELSQISQSTVSSAKFPSLTAIFKDSMFTDLFGKNFNIEQKFVVEEQKKLNLYDCVDLYTKKEFLGGADAVYCVNCKSYTNHTKKLDFKKMPKYLIVHLKRFKYEDEVKKKISSVVDFPMEDLKIGNSVYKIKAISNHIMLGSSCGHYTAYVYKDAWYCFNDSVVSRLREVNKDEAYVLFYEKVDS